MICTQMYSVHIRITSCFLWLHDLSYTTYTQCAVRVLNIEGHHSYKSHNKPAVMADGQAARKLMQITYSYGRDLSSAAIYIYLLFVCDE
jgi:hypothetical protein